MDLQFESSKIHILHQFSLSKKQILFPLTAVLFILFIFLFPFFDSILPLDSIAKFSYGFSSQNPHLNASEKSLVNRDRKKTTCDYSFGRWVRDENWTLESYYSEKCPFLDPGFRCVQNGRKDFEYLNWRWQPQGCNLPRFNAHDFLAKIRNGRIVFVGDSIGRNQWESLVCMLANGVSNQSTIFEENGNPISKHKGFLSIRFEEFNLTVEYYRVPFLVTVGHPPDNSAPYIRRTIKVDKLHWFSNKWAGADVLVFNVGHWWNKEKTAQMNIFFEEMGKVNLSMDASEAVQRSLRTWKAWVVGNQNPKKSLVFFRSYSPVHYRNGTWNSGAGCESNTRPETDYAGMNQPLMNTFIQRTINQINDECPKEKKVFFLNITNLTWLRSDGHPSIYRQPGTQIPAPQDCSHWCLPGIPDTWNEIVNAHLISQV